MAATGWRKNYQRYRKIFLNIVDLYKEREDARVYLELLLTLSTITFFGVFAIRPTLLTISELVKGIETKEEKLAQMEEKTRNLVEAQAIYNVERSRLPLLDTGLPEIPQPDNFARQIEGLIGKHGVQILGLSIGKVTLLGVEGLEKENPKLGSYPPGTSAISFTLNVSGNFTSISSFLADLENLRRPVKIDGFSVNIAETEGVEGLILVITGRTPYIKTASVNSKANQ